jgi:hypothetical protein
MLAPIHWLLTVYQQIYLYNDNNKKCRYCIKCTWRVCLLSTTWTGKMEVEEDRRIGLTCFSIGTAGAPLSSLCWLFWSNLSNVLLSHQRDIVGSVILWELKLSVDFGYNHRRLFAILTGVCSFKLMLNLKFDNIRIPRCWF